MLLAISFRERVTVLPCEETRLHWDGVLGYRHRGTGPCCVCGVWRWPEDMIEFLACPTGVSRGVCYFLCYKIPWLESGQW